MSSSSSFVTEVWQWLRGFSSLVPPPVVAATSNGTTTIAANGTTTNGTSSASGGEGKGGRVSLYFGVACGAVVGVALLGIAYLFLRGLLASRRRERLGLSDLRRYACRSRGHSCSPDVSPVVVDDEDSFSH